MRTRTTHANLSAASPSSALRRGFRPAVARRTALALALGACFLSTHKVYAATDNWIGNESPNFNTLNGFNVVPASGDTLSFNGQGAIGTALNDNLANLYNIAGLIFNTGASGFTIAGNSINLGTGGITDSALNAETVNDALSLTSTPTFNVATTGNTDGSLTLGGVISGTGFGLTQTGNGLLTLGGNNTYTGVTTLSGGTLSVGAIGNGGVAGNLGAATNAATNLVFGGGTLRYTGSSASTDRNFTINTGSNASFDVTAGNTLTDTGSAASSTGGLIKTGAGTLALGGTNLYTGATTVNDGNLTLDFTQATAPAANIIAATSALVLGGTPTTLGLIPQSNVTSTLAITGSASTASTQTFNGTTLNAGTSNIIARGNGTANATIGLGAITHTNGGSVNFSSIGSGSTGLGIFTTSTSNDATGILGGWAVTNVATAANLTTAQAPTDYATVSGGNIVALPAASYNVVTGAISSNTLNNDRVTAAAATALTTANAATTDINTLSLAPANTGGATITVGTAGTGSTGILRVGINGGFLTGSGSGVLTIGNVAGNGTLTAAATSGTPAEITFQTNNSINVNSVIADNGSGNKVGLTVNAYSTAANNTAVTLSGTNTYTGGTYLNSGRLNVGNANALGTGAVTEAAGSQLYFNGGTITNALNIAGGGTSFGDTAGAIRINNATLNGMITLLDDATIGGGSGTIGGQITSNYNLTLGRSANNGAGAGTITLANTSATNLNNYGGNTILSEGTVKLGASNQIPDGSAAGNVVFSGAIAAGTLDLNTFSDTINGLVSTSGTPGKVTNSGSAASTLTVGANNASSVFNGTITDGGAGKTLGITKTGTGTLTLSGTTNVGYIGATNVSQGELNLSGASLGATAVTVANPATFQASGATTIGTGTQATGTGAGSLTLTAGGGTLSLMDGTINILGLDAVTGSTALALGGGNALGFDVGASSADQVLLSAGANATATGTETVNLNLTGRAASNQTYTLISGTGAASTLNNATYTLGTVTGASQFGLGLSLSKTANTLVLTENVAATPPIAYFQGSLGTSWAANNGSTDNFTSDAAGATPENQLPGGTTNVHFYAQNATLANVAASTLDQGTNINSLTVDGSALGESAPVGIAPGAGGTLTINAGTSGGNAAGNGILINAGAGATTISAPVILGAAQSFTNNSSNTLTLSGGLTAGANLLTIAGSGATTLSGATPFTTSAGFTVNSGAGAFTVSAPTTLGAAQTFTNNSANAVAVNGAVTNGANTLTLAGTGNYTLNGAIGSGSGGLTLGTAGSTTGYTGTTTVNTASTYTGATVINSGTLTLTVNNGNPGTLSGTPTITVNNSGILNLTNQDTIGYNANDSALIINSGGLVKNSAAGTRDTLQNTVTMTGGTLAGLAGTGDGNGDFSFGGSPTYNLIATSDASGNAALISASIGLQSTSGVIFNVTRGTGATDLNVTGTILEYNGQTTTLTKTGNGIMTTSGANTYVGTTIVNQGTLITSGSNSSTGQTSLTGGTLQLNSTNNGGIASGMVTDTTGTGFINTTAASAVTLSNAVGIGTGASGFTFGGNQALTVNGAFSTVSAATPTVTFNDSKTVTLAGTIGLGSTAGQGLLVNGTGNALFSGVVSNGTGSNEALTYGGTGTLSLSNTDTYSGATTVNSGTVNLTGALTNSSATISSGGTLTGFGNGTSTGLIGGTLTANGGSAINLATPGSVLKSTGAQTLGTGTAATYGSGTYTNLMYTLGGSSTDEALNTAAALTANNVYVNILNPTQIGNYTLANFASLTGGSDFSLSSTTGNVLTQTVGRDTETLSFNNNTTPTQLLLNITGSVPLVAYFDGKVSKIWNDVSNSTFVNFASNLAGTTDAGNVPAAATDVILNATNATTNQGNPLTETLGSSTTINSLNVNGNGTTTLGADGSTLTINANADSNTGSDGLYTGNTLGNGINVNAGANAFTVGANLALGTNSQSYTNNSANTFTVGGAIGGTTGAQTLTLANTSTGTTTITGAIGNGAAGSLGLKIANTGTGAGLTTTLSGTNTYTGATAVNAGILNLQSGGALGASSGATVASGAALQLQGGISTTNPVGLSLTGTGVGGNGALENVSGSNTYSGLVTLTGNTTVGSDAGTLALTNAGTITGSGDNLTLTGAGNTSIASIIGTGAGSVTKTGAGTATLSGLNTYTGGTTVSAGTLIDNSGTGNNASPTGLGANVSTNGVSVASGATLQLVDVAGSQNYANTFSGAGKIQIVFNNTSTGNVDSTAPNFNNFTGTLELVAPSTGTTADKLQLNGQTGLSGAKFQIDNGTSAYVNSNTTTFGSISVTGAGNSEGLGAIRLGGGTLGGNISLTGSATFDPNGGTATGSISNAAGTAGTQTLTIGGGIGGTATLSGNISDGSGTLALTESNGTAILSGTNSYSGATTITSPGVIQIGSGGTTGTLGTAAVADGGTLTFNRSNALTVSNAISGAGVVNQIGSGTTTLTGADTYTGATSVTGGGLTLGTGGSLANTAVSVSIGKALSATGTGGNTIGTAAGTTGVTLGSGASLSLTSGGINTLNINSTAASTGLNLTSDILNFDVGGSMADSILLGGNASVAGITTINLTSLSAITGTTGSGLALITSGGGLGTNNNFVLGTGSTTLNGYNLSLNDTGSILYLLETPSSVSNAPQAYFTGSQGADLTAANNYVTTPAGGTQASIGAASNVFIAANTASNYTAATVGAPTTINSLNLGTGAASGGGTSISGNTLTINAAGTGGNAAGSGITDASVPATGTTSDTISSNVALGNSQTVTVTNAKTTLTLSGTVSGAGDTLTKAGAGGLVISHAGNSYSGGTVVTGGTLGLNAAAADGSGGLTITGTSINPNTGTGGTGGTVALNTTTTSSAGAGSALGAGGVTLGGGTLANANLTATSAAGQTPQGNNIQNGGALTLTAGTTSVIDFGAGNTGAVFNFTSLTDASPGNTVLDVLNFRGNFNDGTNGGDGLDQLIFGNSKSLMTAQLADIVFVNPYDAQNGIQYGTNFTASQLSDGEVSPAPEPSQYGMMGLMAFGLGGLILRAKRRQAKDADSAA